MLRSKLFSFWFLLRLILLRTRSEVILNCYVCNFFFSPICHWTLLLTRPDCCLVFLRSREFRLLTFEVNFRRDYSVISSLFKTNRIKIFRLFKKRSLKKMCVMMLLEIPTFLFFFVRSLFIEFNNRPFARYLTLTIIIVSYCS